jgi:hypothetical protein
MAYILSTIVEPYFLLLMRFSTLASVTFFTTLLAGRALAQTELPATPQPGSLPARSGQPTYAQQPVYQAPDTRYAQSTLGIDLGWGGPYGWGISYAYLVAPGTDVNAGLGLGVGGKIGVGVRHFLAPSRRLSPYFGLSLSRTGRIDEFTLTLDEGMPTEEYASFTQRPTGVLHFRSGLRWQPGRVGLLGTLGYGARFTGDPAEYAPGINPSPRMRNFVKAVGPGGLEISLGIAIGLGRN